MGRPDLSFSWVESSMHNNSAPVGDLVSIGKKLLSAKVSKSAIMFPGLGNFAEWKLIVFSDAAHANICDGEGSTGGSIIFLVGENDRCCPIWWRTYKLRRVCRSSAAAEGLSLSECLDEAIYLQQLLCQLLGVQRDLI